MAKGTFSDNIFRQEVKDDIVFDLDTKFGGESEIFDKIDIGEEDPRKGLRGLGLNLPEIPGINLDSSRPRKQEEVKPQTEQEKRKDESKGFDLNLGIDFSDIEVPKVDLNLPEPNLQPAADAVTGVVGEVAEGVSSLSEPIVTPIVEASGNVLDAVGQSVADVTGPVAGVIADAVGGITNTLGLVDADTRNIKIKKGDGSGYGEISIGETGAVLDASAVIDKELDEITKATEFEGIKGKDLFDLSTDPTSFIKNKGVEKGADFLTENFGLDKKLGIEASSILNDPEGFIAERGIEEVTEILGNILGASSDFFKESGGISESPIESSSELVDAKSFLSDVVSTGDVGGAATSAIESFGKNVASTATVTIVSTIANAIIPGAGVVIGALSKIFNYSCYLSTSAYHNGFIDKKDYLMFTKYRLRVQSNQWFSNQIWLGYINLFENNFDKMLNNKRVASFLFKYLTGPWLLYINHKLNGSKFSLKGCIADKIIKTVSLGAYLLNYKKSRSKRKKLLNFNVLNVYKRIIKVVEKERSYV